jgi:hypothetical protein
LVEDVMEALDLLAPVLVTVYAPVPTVGVDDPPGAWPPGAWPGWFCDVVFFVVVLADAEVEFEFEVEWAELVVDAVPLPQAASANAAAKDTEVIAVSRRRVLFMVDNS